MPPGENHAEALRRQIRETEQELAGIARERVENREMRDRTRKELQERKAFGKELQEMRDRIQKEEEALRKEADALRKEIQEMERRAGGRPGQTGPRAGSDQSPSTASFVSTGYTYPQFFEAIWQGQTAKHKPDDYGMYLTSFLSMFTNADEAACRRVVGPATVGRVAASGAVDSLGRLFGGMARAHENRGGSRDDMFAQGSKAGAGTIGGMAAQEMGGQRDAQLFYDRHGCASAAARRFFSNLEAFVAQ